MGEKPDNQRPSTKQAAQPFNLKPGLFWDKMDYQKFSDNPNRYK